MNLDFSEMSVEERRKIQEDAGLELVTSEVRTPRGKPKQQENIVDQQVIEAAARSIQRQNEQNMSFSAIAKTELKKLAITLPAFAGTAWVLGRFVFGFGKKV